MYWCVVVGRLVSGFRVVELQSRYFSALRVSQSKYALASSVDDEIAHPLVSCRVYRSARRMSGAHFLGDAPHESSTYAAVGGVYRKFVLTSRFGCNNNSIAVSHEEISASLLEECV